MLYFLIFPLNFIPLWCLQSCKIIIHGKQNPSWTLSFSTFSLSGFKICKELYYQEGEYNYISQFMGEKWGSEGGGKFTFSKYTLFICQCACVPSCFTSVVSDSL